MFLVLNVKSKPDECCVFSKVKRKVILRLLLRDDSSMASWHELLTSLGINVMEYEQAFMD